MSQTHRQDVGRPLRVLLIAEACNPEWTSVPLVGYNLTRAIVGRPDVHVALVSHVRNRAALERSDLTRLAQVDYIDNEFVAAPAYRFAKWLRGGDQLAWTIDTALAWPSYVVFEHLLWRRYARRLLRGDFDLVHRITPLSPISVSPMAGKCPVPMIVGPLNGAIAWPKQFPELQRREREWLSHVRKAYRLLPYYRSTYRHLSAVITASRSAAADVPRHFHGKRFHLPENGIDPNRFPLATDWPRPVGKFRFITSHRLVPYKGLSLTLEAIRRSPRLRECELVVVGDGPDRAEHEAFIAQHQLGSVVRMLGHRPQTELAAEMRRSQVFVFPSLREFGGAVVLEAMACGLPSIVVDYGGPGELVHETTGIKLPMAPREELIESLRRAMERLADSPGECPQFGVRACAIASEMHTWSAKAERVLGIYRECIAT